MQPLVVYASAREGDPLALSTGLRLGVGKSAAAATLAAHLALSQKPGLVFAFGLCGALPGSSATDGALLPVGTACLVGADRFADEGRLDADGFTDLSMLGIGESGPYSADKGLTRSLAKALDVPVVLAATVSTCSGTDLQARAVQARTGAAIETMEGAAIMMVCARFGVPMVHLRVVSNWTGATYRETFALEPALETLHDAVRRALQFLPG